MKEKKSNDGFVNNDVGMKCNNKNVRLKMEHISIPAKKLLDKIASKRVGQTMSELELAGCQQNVKDAVKRQLYGLKKDIEQHIDSEVCYEKTNGK